jgi:hypothetical protein
VFRETERLARIIGREMNVEDANKATFENMSDITDFHLLTHKIGFPECPSTVRARHLVSVDLIKGLKATAEHCRR